MSFPVHIKGTVSLQRGPDSTLTMDSLRNMLADSIRQEEAKSVDAGESEINFEVGWFRPFFGWKLLTPVDGGRIRISSQGQQLLIEYRLSFQRLVLIATAVVALMTAGFLLTEPSLARGPFPFLVFPLMWLWLVGANVATTAFRFPRFIRKCAAEAERQFYIGRKKR